MQKSIFCASSYKGKKYGSVTWRAPSRGRMKTPQAPVALFPHIRQPTIVRATECNIRIRPICALIEKDARVENLDFDSQVIHVLDAGRDIGQIACRHRWGHVSTDLGRLPGYVFRAESEAEQATDFAVDDPVSLLRVTFRCKQHRPKFVFRRR